MTGADSSRPRGYTVRINRHYGGLVQLLDGSGNMWTARRHGYFRRNPIQVGMLFDWWDDKVAEEHRGEKSISFILATGLRLQYNFENDAFEFSVLNEDSSPFQSKLNGDFKLFVTAGTRFTWSDGERVTVTELGLENPNPKKRGVTAFLLEVPVFDRSALLVEDLGPRHSERQVELGSGLSIVNYLAPGEKRWRLALLDKEKAQ